MAKRVTEEEKVEMLRLYAEGMTCEAIGRELGRPPNTVRYHIVPNLREKTLVREKTRYEANSEKMRAKGRAYYEANQEKQLEKAKTYHKANREKILARMKTYYEANREKRSEERKAYYEANQEKILARMKTYREENRETMKAREKAYYVRNLKKERARKNEWGKANRKKKSEYQSRRFSIDVQFHLACCLRSRLNQAIRGNCKIGSAVRDLGCTIAELKVYLESQFLPGMTWDNWGCDGWHIDHIYPLASFDLTDRVQLKEACHYINLRPLWAEENLSKGDKTPEEYRQYQLEAVPA